MSRYTIYVIENNINGKSYVGRTAATPDTRWRAHMLSPNPKKPLGIDVLKFGVAAFSMRILDTADLPVEASIKERLYTHLLEANDPQFGYNTPAMYKVQDCGPIEGRLSRLFAQRLQALPQSFAPM